jgi:hypothetical protein
VQFAAGTVEIGMVHDGQAVQVDTPTVTVRASQAGDFGSRSQRTARAGSRPGAVTSTLLRRTAPTRSARAGRLSRGVRRPIHRLHTVPKSHSTRSTTSTWNATRPWSRRLTQVPT